MKALCYDVKVCLDTISYEKHKYTIWKIIFVQLKQFSSSHLVYTFVDVYGYTYMVLLFFLSNNKVVKFPKISKKFVMSFVSCASTNACT